MAFKTVNVTLGAGATQATSTHTSILECIIYNDVGNAAVKVGDKNITSTLYAFIVPVSAVGTGITGIERIGPFSGDRPFNLEDVWFLGTQNNIIRLGIVA